MLLNYELLKKYVAKVEILEDLNVGDYTELYNNLDQVNKDNFMVDEHDELIIKKGQNALLYVQPHNYHYELRFDNGEQIDVTFDDDNDLNKYFKVINIEGINIKGKNKYFN